LADKANGKAAVAARDGAEIAHTLSFDRDEHTEGISAAGIAGTVAGGHVIAISVPAPSERFLAEEPIIVAALRDAAVSPVWLAHES
jgi:IclR family transcriptional regulator, acetate operon repressor